MRPGTKGNSARTRLLTDRQGGKGVESIHIDVDQFFALLPCVAFLLAFFPADWFPPAARTSLVERYLIIVAPLDTDDRSCHVSRETTDLTGDLILFPLALRSFRRFLLINLRRDVNTCKQVEDPRKIFDTSEIISVNDLQSLVSQQQDVSDNWNRSNNETKIYRMRWIENNDFVSFTNGVASVNGLLNSMF